MYNLFTKLDMTGPDTYDCNCAVQDKQLNGMCTLRVGVCYYFASLGDCQNHQVVYKAYAYDQATGNQANSASTNPAGFTNSTDAAVTAVTNLIMNFPLEAKACGYGVADHEKIAAHMLI